MKIYFDAAHRGATAAALPLARSGRLTHASVVDPDELAVRTLSSRLRGFGVDVHSHVERGEVVLEQTEEGVPAIIATDNPAANALALRQEATRRDLFSQGVIRSATSAAHPGTTFSFSATSWTDREESQSQVQHLHDTLAKLAGRSSSKVITNDAMEGFAVSRARSQAGAASAARLLDADRQRGEEVFARLFWNDRQYGMVLASESRSQRRHGLERARDLAVHHERTAVTLIGDDWIDVYLLVAGRRGLPVFENRLQLEAPPPTPTPQRSNGGLSTIAVGIAALAFTD